MEKNNTSKYYVVYFHGSHTNDSTYIFPPSMALTWYNIGALALEGLCAFLTAISNAFVIITILKVKQLRTPFNLYILNLSLADFLVGFPVMPLITTYTYFDYWPYGSFSCDFLVYVYYLTTFESVLSLTIISCDRLWSLNWSVHYRTHRSNKKSVCLLISSWLYNIMLWTPAFTLDRLRQTNSYACAYAVADIRNRTAIIIVASFGYFLPLSLMIISYIRISQLMFRRSKQVLSLTSEGPSTHRKQDLSIVVNSNEEAQKLQQRRKKERKTFLLLGHIIVIFLICWIPFYGWFALSNVFPHTFSLLFIYGSWFLADLNSMFNPIMYTLSNPEIRNALKNLFGI